MPTKNKKFTPEQRKIYTNGYRNGYASGRSACGRGKWRHKGDNKTIHELGILNGEADASKDAEIVLLKTQNKYLAAVITQQDGLDLLVDSCIKHLKKWNNPTSRLFLSRLATNRRQRDRNIAKSLAIME